jgi:uncharacterized heparinase superfamily protein
LSILKRTSLYWHTLRHLRPVQFYGRLWFRLARPRIAADRLHPAQRPQGSVWTPSAAHHPCMLGPRQFRFLNEEGNLDALGWDDPTREKLWRYNLHYFDDLTTEAAANRAPWHLALLADWVRWNAPGRGSGWEPYPCSLRIVNWIKWALAGNSLPEVCLQSLAVQTRWLSKRIEWHLQGNHLFVNAKALVLAGLFFEGPEADHWLQRGLSIIAKQLPEQVLADGGNFELSPMYHAIFLEDILDLVNGAQAFPGLVDTQTVTAWREVAGRMLRWFEAMCHPDGEISLFNDAAIGIAPRPGLLVDYAARLGIGSPPDTKASAFPVQVTHFQESGYVRVEMDDCIALIDVAAVGPDYLPGHAHADTLSFELSVGAQRIIVNGGTSRYGASAERLRERGTPAHSTVTIDGENSSQVWSGFRVAQRAQPFGLEVQRSTDGASIACAHDGYMRLRGKPVHRRQWLFTPGQLRIQDRIEGGFQSAQARYHFHPDVQVVDIGMAGYCAHLPDGRALRLSVPVGDARLERSQYAPAFGVVQPTQCLCIDVRNGDAALNIEWI